MQMTVRSVNVPRDPTGDSPRPGTGTGDLRLEPATGPVEIGMHGLASAPPAGSGADTAFSHALYAYPTLHHEFWRTVRAQARVAPPDSPLAPGQFDEHLALDGLQESQLWIGDLLKLPDCTLVVSAPRLPDARFNETLGFAHAARMVAQSRWCGFWLAVRRPGRIAARDPFELVPGPRVTGLVELFRARIKGRVF